jgi:hypothetical protein
MISFSCSATKISDQKSVFVPKPQRQNLFGYQKLFTKKSFSIIRDYAKFFLHQF